MVQVSDVVTSIDLTDLRCPFLGRRIRKALARAGIGERLTFVCSDPLAAIDVPHLVTSLGDELLAKTESGQQLTFVVRRAPRSSTL